jgi:hypothetical protein
MNYLRRFALTIALASMLPAAAMAAKDDPRNDSPLGLITTAQVAPADRMALRKAFIDKGLAQLERFKREGRVADYRVLFSRYADSETFDLFVELSFARTEDVTRWKEVELTNPGGFPKEALRLIKTMATVPVDRMRQGEAAKLSRQPTFLVIPYDYLVSTNDYLKFLDDYLVPQVSGWVDEGIVSRYGIYIGRYAANRPWSSLFLIEYNDDAALGKRDSTVAKVRARLAVNPEWRAIHEKKDKIRNERAPIIADQLSLAPGQAAAHP